RGGRDHVRCPAAVVENADFAEAAARPERPDQLSVDGDHGRPLPYDEQVIGERALAGDYRAEVDLHLLQPLGDALELTIGKVLEERYRSKFVSEHRVCLRTVPPCAHPQARQRATWP